VLNSAAPDIATSGGLQPPPSPKVTSRQQAAQSSSGVPALVPRIPALVPTEGLNSFYRIDSRDANGAFTGETYHVGIIDIFTRYSAKKRGEHVYKSFQGNGSAISAVNPRQYQQRFVKFISKIAVDN